MSNKQPSALRMADALSNPKRWHELSDDDCETAADELRRLHALNAQMLDALKDLTLNVNEAMRTGGWVPSPLQSSFWASMTDAMDAIAAATEAQQ